MCRVNMVMTWQTRSSLTPKVLSENQWQLHWLSVEKEFTHFQQVMQLYRRMRKKIRGIGTVLMDLHSFLSSMTGNLMPRVQYFSDSLRQYRSSWAFLVSSFHVLESVTLAYMVPNSSLLVTCCCQCTLRSPVLNILVYIPSNPSASFVRRSRLHNRKEVDCTMAVNKHSLMLR